MENEKKVVVHSPLGVEWMFFHADASDEVIKARIEEIHNIGIVTYSAEEDVYHVTSKKQTETPEEKRHVNVRIKDFVFTMVFPTSFSDAKICGILGKAFDSKFGINPKKRIFYQA